MFKQVEKSERIRGLVAKAYGDGEVRLDDLAIFEAVAVNTRPLKRSHGLFARAVLTEDTLHEMRAWLEAGNHVPLQTMHRDGIPKGKVFAGETRRNSDGTLALHTLFYLPMSAGESEMIRKINAGVIAEVSIGVENREIRCSACGFDYLGSDATIEHVFSCTCSNGHTIGQAGVHARLHGLQKWMELSLVDRGAAQGATILPRPQQTFQMDEKRGFDRTALRLFASADEPNKETPPNMDELVKAKVDLGLAVAAKDALTAQLSEATTKLEAAKAETVSVQTKLTAALAEVEELKKGDAVKLKAELDAAQALIDEMTKTVLVATGKQPTLPATLAEKIETIKAGRTQLALAIPAGGASHKPGGDDNAHTKGALAAFRRPAQR